MSFVLSNREFTGATKRGELFLRESGGAAREGRDFFHFDGIIYPDPRTSEEVREGWSEGGRTYLEGLNGDFQVVSGTSGAIEFSVDRLGRYFLYYLCRDGRLLVSDDFWAIVSVLEPGLDDLDHMALKELGFLGRPYGDTTIIKGLSRTVPATHYRFELKGVLETTTWWDFNISGEQKSIEHAVDRFDELANEGMRQIRDRHEESTKFGIGLSGGLDSRLVSHYAVKNGMKLLPYVLGDMGARDVRISKRIAETLKLDEPVPIQYDVEPYEDKSRYDLKFNPQSACQYFNAIHQHLPPMDVYLSGVLGGELFGQGIRWHGPEFLEWSPERMHKLLMGGTYLRGRKSIAGIVSEDEVASFDGKIRMFISENSEKDNVSLHQKFLYNFKASFNRLNYFYGLHGQKPSYGLFLNPFIISEALTWDPTFFLKTHAQHQIFLRKIPDLARIPDQTKAPSIHTRHSLKHKVLSQTPLVARSYNRGLDRSFEELGGSGLSYADWMKEDEFRSFAAKAFDNDCTFFGEIFDVNVVKGLVETGDLRIFANLLKVKHLVDIIETRDPEYLSF